MVSRFFQLLLIIVISIVSFSVQSFADINFGITPIKYELNLSPGGSITLPASIRNNSNASVHMTTATSDFVAQGVTGVPSFVRKSEKVHAQEFSSWITLSASGVTMAAGEKATINFTINVPTNATPGGHYAGVLFNYEGSEASGKVAIDVNYAIIILLNVSGTVVVGGEVSPPTIHSGNYTSSGGVINDNVWYVGVDDEGNDIFETKDVCPLGDFTSSKYDGSCIIPPTDNISGNDGEPILFDGTNFQIGFSIPIENTGNTHLKPTGKIILKDENGKQIIAVGKKSISNEQGAIIGEEIVDYIPINDQGGNVLPQTKRIFESEWKGFPYKTYDEQGNQIVNYWSPSEYYTEKNKSDAGFLMFWERVSEVRQSKMITAETELIYLDENGEEVIFNSAQEFPIQYIEQRVTLNPYIIASLILLLSAGAMIWFATRTLLGAIKWKSCWNCHKKIKSHWLTCPHCRKKQNKKEQEKLDKKVKKTTKKGNKKK